MVKAAIFDLDGTLMDSEILWVSAVEDYLNDQFVFLHAEIIACDTADFFCH